MFRSSGETSGDNPTKMSPSPVAAPMFALAIIEKIAPYGPPGQAARIRNPTATIGFGVEYHEQSRGDCRNEDIVSEEHSHDQFPISRGGYKVVHRGCQTNEDHPLDERDESEEVEHFAKSYGSVSFLHLIVPLPNSSLRIRSNRLEIFIFTYNNIYSNNKD